jgi:hypothetical protein
MTFTGGSGGHGVDPGTENVRIMDPNGPNPNGYVNYGNTQDNGGWQSIDPYTGKPISPKDDWWHMPRW